MFERGSPQEFRINEAIADMGDVRVVGIVNRLRAKLELDATLEQLMREARHRVDEITREHVINQRELTDIMNNIERANLFALIRDQERRMFQQPVTTPEPTPLPPRQRGPAEFPILMDGNPRQVKCYRCRKRGHIARECPRKKQTKCRVCGYTDHVKADCPWRAKPAVQVFVDHEVSREVQDLGKMTLLDRIALLDRSEWTPPFCGKCGKSNPQHTELDCPRYEYCDWCRQTGAFRFVKKHRCQYVEEDDTPMCNDWEGTWNDGED
jgi:hypothetical protein